MKSKSGWSALRFTVILGALGLTALGWAQKIQIVPQVAAIEGETVVSPDGRLMATAGIDFVQVWDVRSGLLIRTILVNADLSKICGISPQDDSVLTLDRGGASRWDLRTGKLLKRQPSGEAAFVGASLQGNGQVRTVDAHGTLQMWDPNSGESVQRIALGITPTSAQWSPDGKWLAVATTDAALHLLDATTGRTALDIAADGWPTIGVRFSLDSSMMGAIGGARARIWDLKSRRLLKSFTIGTPSVEKSRNGIPTEQTLLTQAPALAFSPDGTHLVTPADGFGIQIWDIRSGVADRKLTGHSYLPISAAYTADGNRLITSAYGAETIIWDAKTGAMLSSVKAPKLFGQFASFSPDGNCLVAGSADAAGRIWHTDAGRTPIRLEGSWIGVAAFGSPASVAGTGVGNQAQLWDAHDGHLLASFRPTTGALTSVATSPDGRRIVTTDNEKLAKVWIGQGNTLSQTLTGHSGPVRSAAFSPDGKWIVTASDDRTARVWDAASGKNTLTLTGHANSVRSAQFSPDGHSIVTSSLDGTVRVWDARTGSPTLSIPVPVPGGGFQSPLASFSPDGSRILTVGSDTASVWDATSGHLVVSLALARRPLSASFSPDGTRIVTELDDRTAQLWDAASGKELGSLFGFADGSWGVTDPEGRFDISSLDGNVNLHWVVSDSPLTPLPIEIFMRDYFEPGLLDKIWHQETMRPVRSLVDLNRAQPTLNLDAKVADHFITVVVSATTGTTTLERNGAPIVQTGNPQDLRLFIDDKLVAHEDGVLQRDSMGNWSKTYKIPVPQNGEKEVEVIAYCFNQDRVKSPTARQTLPVNADRKPGRAYVITVGIDHYALKGMDLAYAVADARTMSEALATRIAGYTDVVTVPLLSDANHHDGTKAKVQAVLGALAGRTSDLSGVPNGDKIRPSTSEDLIILSWSGHGLSASTGEFYLVTEDVPNGPDLFAKATLNACVSSDDLTNWLRDVQAGDMALIIDACHSAASVQNKEFKPGPLGNRGLGQLAFDKGIRILAATQAEGLALESGKLGNGLLTYALVHDGLANGATPSLRGWLAGAVDDVPRLYDAISKGTLKVARGTEPATYSGSAASKSRAQTPVLFDYSSRKPAIPFVG